MSLSFKQRIWKIVRKIPRGTTMTYKEVAKRAGKPGAYRAVGNILSTNHDPKIPCHRVVRSDGKIGDYNRGMRLKLELLKKEGAIA